MSVLKDFIEFIFKHIQDHAKEMAERKAFKVRPEIPSDGRSIFYEYDGKIVERAIPARLRDHKVHSLDDLIGAFAKWTNDNDGVIWLAPSGVTLVLNDACRRECVEFPLVTSVLFQKVQSLMSASCCALDQKQLLQLLRREFRDAVGAREMRAAVSRLNFKKVEQGNSSVSNGNESMGRSIEMEVCGAEDIGDQLIVRTNLWDNPGERESVFEIPVDVEIDVDNQRFLLRPLADEVEKAIAAGIEGIRCRLEEDLPKATILYGTP